MAKKLIFVLGMACLFFSFHGKAATGLSGTYTIDPSKSASSTNFTSIANAISALTATAPAGYVTFQLADGTYNEQIKLDSFGQQYVTDYQVTFTSISGDSSKVILKYTKKPKEYTVNITNSYLGLTFEKVSILSGDSHAVYIDDNYQFTTYKNCRLEKLLVGGNSMHFLNCYLNQGIWRSGGACNDVFIKKCYFDSWGIEIGSAGWNINGVIDSSIFNNASVLFGDDLYGNATFTNNIVKGASTYVFLDGYYDSVAYNIIEGSLDISGDNPIGFVYNNYLTGRCSFPSGFYDHNTITGPLEFVDPPGTVSRFNLTNNILSGNIVVNGDLYDSLALEVEGWHNNCYKQINIAFSHYMFGINYYTDFATWLKASLTDSNSFVADPYFYSSTDLRPSNYKLDGKARPDTISVDDIFHHKRGTKPDVGAAEFDPHYNDLAVTEIVSPQDKDCGTGSTMVGVRIANPGYLSQKGFTVKVQASGATTASTTYSFSGTLASASDSVIYITFSPALSTLAGEKYTFKAYTVSSVDSNPANDTAIKIVDINPAPQARFHIPAASACLGSKLSVMDSSTVGTPASYKYYLTDASGKRLDSSTVKNPSFSIAKAGSYRIWQQASSGSCADSTSMAVTISSPPTANFAVDNLCAGDTAAFTDSSTAAVSWHWDFGDKSTSSLQNPTHAYAKAASYNVRLKVTSAAGCTDSLDKTITIDAHCVWPGDANNDKIVDAKDLLTLGVGYGTKGPGRSRISTTWQAENCTDWKDTFANGANYKHGDCNGDGIINSTDTLAVSLNYSKTHPKTLIRTQGKPSDPPLFVKIAKGTYHAGDTVTADVIFGLLSSSAKNVYGLAFDIDFDPALVDAILDVQTASSWLSRQPLILVKNNSAAITLAQVRTNHKDTSGFGKIATVRFRTAAGLTSDANMAIRIYNNYQINSREKYTPVYMTDDSVTLHPTITGLEADAPGKDELHLSPNPAQDNLLVRTGGPLIREVRIFSMEGREVYASLLTGSISASLDISRLPAGMYLVRARTDEGTAVRRLLIAR